MEQVFSCGSVPRLLVVLSDRGARDATEVAGADPANIVRVPGPRPVVEKELKVGHLRQPAFHSQDAS